MKKRKFQKKDIRPKSKSESEDHIHHPRKPLEKIKYRHKNHWLEEDEYELTMSFKMEEE
jgi:hypothetical protein